MVELENSPHNQSQESATDVTDQSSRRGGFTMGTTIADIEYVPQRFLINDNSTTTEEAAYSRATVSVRAPVAKQIIEKSQTSVDEVNLLCRGEMEGSDFSEEYKPAKAIACKRRDHDKNFNLRTTIANELDIEPQSHSSEANKITVRVDQICESAQNLPCQYRRVSSQETELSVVTLEKACNNLGLDARDPYEEIDNAVIEEDDSNGKRNFASKDISVLNSKDDKYSEVELSIQFSDEDTSSETAQEGTKDAETQTELNRNA